MNKKIGKFKMWQLIAAGVALGAILYIYSHKKESTTGEAEILGATGGPGFGPVEGSGGSDISSGNANGESLDTFLGRVDELREAGFFPNEKEVIEKESPGPVQGEFERLQRANRLLQKRAHDVQHKQTKHEHKTTQKPTTTGGSAHTKQTHHANAHPAVRVAHAKAVGRKRKRH